MSENRWVRDAFEGTHCHLHIARIMNRVDVENIAITLEEHALIAKEITGGTAKGARGAMTEHLEAARDRTIAAYEAFHEPPPNGNRQ
jgi:DNA-binding GntR family transcriptional regulator